MTGSARASRQLDRHSGIAKGQPVVEYTLGGLVWMEERP